MAKTKRETAIHDTLGRLADTLKAEGAEQVSVSYVSQRSFSLTVREGELEGMNTSEAMGISMKVWIGAKSESTSLETNNPDDLSEAARSLVKSTLAKPDNPHALPADPAQFSKVRTNKRLDLYDPAKPDSVYMLEQARAMESAALAIPYVVKSDGASVSWSESMSILKTTFGFEASSKSTRNSLGIAVIAEKGGAMQTGGEGDSAIYSSDLEDPSAIGRRAGQEAVNALNPRQATTGQFPVIFHPDLAKSLLAHFANAVDGENIRKGATFLSLDNLGKRVLSPSISILHNPHLKRGLGSDMMTSDGLPSQKFWVVKDGNLEALLLDLENARRLGLDKTAIIGGESNLTIEPGIITPEDMIADVADGLYVTGLMGQGVDSTSGNYSRGAAGFWIKNGKIAYPVDKATIAGNLRDMFCNMSAANDLRRMRGSVAAPTLRIDGMMIA